MARGTTLTNLLARLKAELGYSQDASATASDATLTLLLANKQRWLCGEFDWPFLDHKWDISLAAGSRFVSLPTATSTTDDLGATLSINFERPVHVSVNWANWWQPVFEGIDDRELNMRRSSQGEAQDPVQKWRMTTDTSEAASADKIEVWPIPASAQTLRIQGQREPIALTSANEKADLDDTLLVLFVAAELLARQDQHDAQLKAGLAQKRLASVRANYPVPYRKMVLGRMDSRLTTKRIVSIGNS